MWVLYARHCSKLGARKIYQHLYSKEIGIDFGMLYEEWANSIEQHPENAKTIENILDLGIQRGAEPLNRLKKRKATILKRVSQSTSKIILPSVASNSNHELSDDPLKNHRTRTTTLNPNQPHSKKPPAPTAQRLAVDLSKLYPGNGVEISPEEYKAMKQYGSRRWGVEPWEVEAFTSGSQSKSLLIHCIYIDSPHIIIFIRLVPL